MKNVPSFAALSVLILLSLSSARAEVLASDSFGSTSGDLNGSEGGTGKWVSAWQIMRGAVDGGEFKIEAKGGEHFLRAKGDGRTQRVFVTRLFEEFTGDKIFVRFKVEAEELPDEKSSFYFFFQSGEAFSIAYRLNMGIKDGMLMARYYPDNGGTRKGPSMEVGKTYAMVGEFSKSEGGDFDTVRFWVDPGPDDYFSGVGEVSLPTHQLAGGPGKHRTQSVNVAGFALDGEHPGAVRIRDLVIGTNWEDITGAHK